MVATPAEHRIAPILKRLALFFALTVAIVLPGGYWSVTHSNLVEHVESLDEVKAGNLTALVAANPDLWMYQLQRMDELLLRYPVPLREERATVRDLAGNSIFTTGAAPDAPVLVRSSPVYDSGRIVGHVEIEHSYRAVLFGTLAAALVGLLLGITVYATLLILPMRALGQATAALVRGQEALRKGEENYRLLFEANPHPMWVFDDKTLSFLAVNDAAVAKYGWSREEFLAMTVADIRRAEDVPVLLKQLATSNETDLCVVKGSRHRTRHGTFIDVEVSSHFVEFGGRRAWVATAYDITERKRAEESLRAAEEQYRGLVEQSIAGIYIIQDGTFAYVNPRFAAIRGYGSAGEMFGLDPLLLIAETDRSTVAEHNRRLLAGETRSIDYVFTALRKDGSTLEAGVHSAFATYRGRPAIIGMMQDISEKRRAEDEIKRHVTQLEKAMQSTINVVATIGELRDPYTHGHERRVGEIAAAIAAEMELEASRVEGIRITGYLHDIGKIAVPAEILAKPGRLTKVEFGVVKDHAQQSYEILKTVEFPWPVAESAWQHHERLDGSGYPRGLKGDQISLEARILGVADTVEAMASHRPYRPGLGIEKALAEVENNRGKLYDPQVVDACLRLFRAKGYTLPA